MKKTVPLFALTAMACLATSSGVQADTLRAPGVLSQPRTASPIDPNTFIVGHPASPTNRVVRANFDHPAVAMHRAGKSIDANEFLVQPPTSVAWISPRKAQSDNTMALDLNALPPTAAGSADSKPAR